VKSEVTEAANIPERLADNAEAPGIGKLLKPLRRRLERSPKWPTPKLERVHRVPLGSDVVMSNEVVRFRNRQLLRVEFNDRPVISQAESILSRAFIAGPFLPVQLAIKEGAFVFGIPEQVIPDAV
jgi:hypothetical protein